MSAAMAVSRVGEIQQMLAALQGGPQVQPPDASFQAALTTAQGAQGAAAPAAVGSTMPAAAGPGSPTPYEAEIQAAAQRHGLDPSLLKALIKQESNFDPNAGSPAGAQGLTQLMPATARSLGVTNPHDPAQAIEGGAKYLKQQLDRFGGDVEKALAAYNAGPGAVQKFGGIPPYPETQNYVKKVMAFAEQYRAGGGGAAAPAAAATPPVAGPAVGTVASSPGQFGIT